MKNKILFTLLFLMFGVWDIHAQSQKVTGKVIDSEGYEVIGANVVIKGAAGVGTITNVDGQYTLTVNDASKDVLVFSYIGMQNLEVPVKGQSEINVTLKADAVMLDEVVAIGYATVKRKDLTGSVTSIRSEELLKTPTSDITQALAGRMAGVQVMQNDGAPGSSISIRVRGGISITQSNEPLYVIDGFPTEDGMASLDPAEIETIDILKDASATAIYGARGANGVVVITTKNGSKESGKATVTFNAYVGVRKLAKKLDVLNPYEYLLADYERTLGTATTEETMISWQNRYGSFLDLEENYRNRNGVNWQEEALGRTTFTQNYSVGVNGGNDKTKYSLSYSYFDDEGAMVYSGNNKHNISLNINSQVNDRLTVNARASFDQRKIYGAGTAGNGTNEDGSNVDARFNKMSHILGYRPVNGLLNSDEDLKNGNDNMVDDEGNVMQNPLISAREETNDKEFRTFQVNGGFTFKILKGLSFRNTTGMRYQTVRNELFFGDQSITGKRTSINGSIRNTETGSFQTSNVLTYSKKLKKHNFTAMLGQEYVNRWTRYVNSMATNFPNDEIGLGDMSLGTPSAIQTNKNYDDKLFSFFGRVNYDYADKYLFTASLRADGSSKFGKNNKWGYFPAVSAGWRISDEAFMKDIKWINNLKIRADLGVTGNQEFGSYLSLATYGGYGESYFNGQYYKGWGSNKNPNPNLKWEKGLNWNVGVDFELFNILSGSINYYNRKQQDLLGDYKVSLPPYIWDSMFVNVGTMRNTGVEVDLNIQAVKTKDFSYNIGLVGSTESNKFLDFSNQTYTGQDYYETVGMAGPGSPGNLQRISKGERIGNYYVYRYAGVGDDGNWQVYNKDNEVIPIGQAKEEDKTIGGNGLPKFSASLNNTFVYKNFDLSVYFRGVFGFDIYNVHDMYYGLQAVNAPYNGLKKAFTDNKHITNGHNLLLDYFIERGDYVKLDVLSLGYTINIDKKWLERIRVYATARNLFTITGFSGVDPAQYPTNGLTPGTFNGGRAYYPSSTQVLFGAQISF